MTDTRAKHTILAPIRAIIYLRLSDLRQEDLDDQGVVISFASREARLRELADRLGWTVVDVVRENDLRRSRSGKVRGASAYKRRKVKRNGVVELRVWRPGFQSILDRFHSGVANALLAEDLDRTMRDPRDLEDFIDLAAEKKINARSLSGSLTFTDGGTDAERAMARIMVTIAHKSSADTSRRVAAARERKALAGEFGGGIRPFGFETDGVTVRESEAAIIRNCTRRIITNERGDDSKKPVTLGWLAAELRKGDVPTVTGAPWSARALRSILLRDRNAGLNVRHKEVIGAARWEPIVQPDELDDLRRILLDPGRKSGPGATPKWMGTGLYQCGRCDDGGTSVQVTTGSELVRQHDSTGNVVKVRKARSPRYRCKAAPHLARSVELVDTAVTAAVFEQIARMREQGWLLSHPTADVDVAALRTEREQLEKDLDQLGRDLAARLVDRRTVITFTATANERLTEIAQLMCDADTGEDPVRQLIDAEDIKAEWELLRLPERRTVIDRLFVVTLLPATRSRKFDPDSIRIDARDRDRALADAG